MRTPLLPRCTACDAPMPPQRSRLGLCRDCQDEWESDGEPEDEPENPAP